MTTRDKISDQAWRIGHSSQTRASLAYDGTHDSEQFVEEWSEIAGVAFQLNNDTCEAGHKIKTLRPRLTELNRRFRAMIIATRCETK